MISKGVVKFASNLHGLRKCFGTSGNDKSIPTEWMTEWGENVGHVMLGEREREKEVLSMMKGKTQPDAVLQENTHTFAIQQKQRLT
jgi:hypothetical protein